MKYIKGSVFASEISSRQEAQPLKQRNNNCIAKVPFQEKEGVYLLYFYVQAEKSVDISWEKRPKYEDDLMFIGPCIIVIVEE